MKFLPFGVMVGFPLVGGPSCGAEKRNTRFRYAKQTQTSRNQNNLRPLETGLFDWIDSRRVEFGNRVGSFFNRQNGQWDRFFS
jgi:hypothetical protein